MKNVYVFKGCGTKELITEFLNKGWKLRGLKKHLKKRRKTGRTAGVPT